jgi:exopolyphosphatase/guanosine-5'-triphosphate,3'-diphosphate pyrophosphatase
MPRAVLDVGSNTIRLLVGTVDDGRVTPLLDRSEFVRLGRGVDASGRLQPERERAAVEAIGQLAEEARSLGADQLTAIATSAVRDAANGREFVDRVRAETGVTIEIISGDREAQLTFRGATSGVDLAGGVIVCDLGGGSAELIAASPSGIRWAVSEKLGSGRLSERFAQHDPPAAAEMQSLEDHVMSVLRDLPETAVRTAIFTGGTASHLALLTGLSEALTRLAPDDIERALETLTSAPAQAIAERYNFRRERAEVLPAGVAALLAMARFYRVQEVVITLSGLREGTLLSAD